MAEAPRDQNHVPATLLESSSTPGLTITAKGDQATGRLLVSLAGVVTSGFQIPTGTVDGSNRTFVFASAPNAIVVDGSTLQKTDQTGGGINWTGTTTVVMAVAPNYSIFSVA
jgi:hypothetical protein